APSSSPSSPTAAHGGDSPAPSSPPTGGTRRRPFPLPLLSHWRHRFEPLYHRRRLGEDVVVAASRRQRVPLPSLGYPESTKRRRPSRAPQLWEVGWLGGRRRRISERRSSSGSCSSEVRRRWIISDSLVWGVFSSREAYLRFFLSQTKIVSLRAFA
ncbi:hypothetical protein EE612_049951, partial [Oryza sativa]